LFISMPQYFSQVCNYTEDTIGLLLGFNGLLVVLIEMPLVAALEKKKKIFPFIIAGTLCIPIAFAIVKFGNGMMLWAIVYILVITFSEIFAMPFMMNYTLSRPPKERQGQYSALYSIGYGIAMIVAPVFGLGIAGKYGFDSMFYCLMILGILTSLGFVFLNKRTKV
jgi:MFS family permease